MIYDDLSMSQVEITRYNKALFTETGHYNDIWRSKTNSSEYYKSCK